MEQSHGTYKWKHVRDGKILHEGERENTVTVQGRNHILTTEFLNGTQSASWFFGLINNAGFGSNPDSDTMLSHPGWSEFTSYTEGTRQQWSPGSASAGALTNSSPAVFEINATGTIWGFFISSNSTKGGTSGTLWSSLPFATGPLSVVSGDEIQVTYTYQLGA